MCRRLRRAGNGDEPPRQAITAPVEQRAAERAIGAAIKVMDLAWRASRARQSIANCQSYCRFLVELKTYLGLAQYLHRDKQCSADHLPKTGRADGLTP